MRAISPVVSALLYFRKNFIDLSHTVECYGAWGPEALKVFSQVATRLAIRGNTSKLKALTVVASSHSLIGANARAILSRSYSNLVQQVDELCV